MGRIFKPARMNEMSPEIQALEVTAAQTFKEGACVVDVAAGTISECGADPAAIYGVALQAAFTNPGNAVANAAQNVFTTGGQPNRVSVAIANRRTIFSGRGVNGATDPVTPALTNIGEVYGLASASGEWVIDIAETSNTRVEIVDIDIDNKIFYFKFLEANLARP